MYRDILNVVLIIVHMVYRLLRLDFDFLRLYNQCMHKKYEFIVVDIQNEFASEGGKFYTYKPSITFLNEKIFPYFREKNIKVNEIISDYRQPRNGDTGDGCHPGEWGYQSVMPDDLRKSLWIKCMNSPV